MYFISDELNDPTCCRILKLWTRVIALWPSAALYVLVSAATVIFVVTSALPMNHCYAGITSYSISIT